MNTYKHGLVSEKHYASVNSFIISSHSNGFGQSELPVLQAVRKILKTNPTEPGPDIDSIVLRTIRNNDIKTAESIIPVLEYFWPNHHGIDNLNGLILYASRDFKKSEVAFRDAYSKHVTAEYHLNWAESSLQLGQAAQVIESIESAKYPFLYYGLSQYVLARSWLSVRSQAKASICFKNAFNGDRCNPHIAIGYAHYLLNHSRYSEASKVIQQNWSIFTEYRELMQEAVRISIACGNADLARNLLKHCDDSEFYDPERASLSFLEGDITSSARIYRSRLAKNPFDSGLCGSVVVPTFLIGNVLESLNLYEWRLASDKQTTLKKYPFPSWDGKTRDSGYLLVHGEQGVGDQIMFSQFLNHLPREQKAIVTTNERIRDILQRTHPDVAVVSKQADLRAQLRQAGITHQTMIGSLGRHLFESAVGPIVLKWKPAVVRPDLTSNFKERYRRLFGNSPLIGLSWWSSNEKLAFFKNPPVSDWRRILGIKGVVFINLQYGPFKCSLDSLAEECGATLFQDSTFDQMSDMESFFAQVDALNHVVTVSNTALHVAGAAGKPTSAIIRSDLPLLTAARFNNQSFWYPKTKFFTYDTTKAWGSAFESVELLIKEAFV